MEEFKSHSANGVPLTPLSFLERAAIVYGDCPSVIYDNTTYTWSQTHSRCLRLASALTSVLSISTGDIVSVLAPNVPAMYEMQFGVPMSGAILNNLNIRLDARTLAILLCHCESKLLFVDHEYLDLIRNILDIIRSQGGSPPIVVPVLEDGETNGDGLTYENLISKGDPNFEWVRPVTEMTPMVLNYTSGTTSAPKGVVHCHRGLFLITVDSLLDWSVPLQPIYLWTLPIFHANGWSYPWGIAAVGGVNICLRRFDAEIVFSAINRHKVTHLCGAPVVLNMLGSSSSHSLPNEVYILTAGAPPPAAILSRTEALGFHVRHGYGLTETAGLVITCAWKRKWNSFPVQERAKLKSRQGVRTLAMDSFDIVDSNTGKKVKNDGVELGEVVLRGGCVMLGYLKDKAATEKCIKNGWFYTGDVGVMHPDGYIEIKDRSKDVIISGGENMSSIEVESVLYMHPGVNEAAVVARPDVFWGESPCAFVSLKEGGEATGQKMKAEEIVAFCRERLPHFMVPKTVVFKKELPKTSTGKIQKFALREIAKSMGSATAPSVSRM